MIYSYAHAVITLIPLRDPDSEPTDYSLRSAEAESDTKRISFDTWQV